MRGGPPCGQDQKFPSCLDRTGPFHFVKLRRSTDPVDISLYRENYVLLRSLWAARGGRCSRFSCFDVPENCAKSVRSINLRKPSIRFNVVLIGFSINNYLISSQQQQRLPLYLCSLALLLEKSFHDFPFRYENGVLSVDRIIK